MPVGTQDRLVNGNFNDGLAHWMSRCKNMSVKDAVLVVNDQGGTHPQPSFAQEVGDMPENSLVTFSVDLRNEGALNRKVILCLWELGGGEPVQTATDYQIDTAWRKFQLACVKTRTDSIMKAEVYWEDHNPINLQADNASLMVTSMDWMRHEFERFLQDQLCWGNRKRARLDLWEYRSNEKRLYYRFACHSEHEWRVERPFPLRGHWTFTAYSFECGQDGRLKVFDLEADRNHEVCCQLPDQILGQNLPDWVTHNLRREAVAGMPPAGERFCVTIGELVQILIAGFA